MAGDPRSPAIGVQLETLRSACVSLCGDVAPPTPNWTTRRGPARSTDTLSTRSRAV